jgi:high-affinity K+ transport system ATPase subunit B
VSTFDPIKTKTHMGGPQRLYRFANGYGASVVNNDVILGTEMAVIKWEGDDDFTLVYDTPLTDDVINYLTEDETQQFLERISNLTEDGKNSSELALGGDA